MEEVSGMRTAQVSNLQGVLFDEVVTIVRGSTSFSISKYELEDLISVLRRLAAGLAPEPGSDEAQVVTEAVALAGLNIDEIEKRSQKSRMWHELRRYLQSCQRAQGMNSMVRQMRRARIVDGDPSALIEEVIAERIETKDVMRTKSGRYTLGRGR